MATAPFNPFAGFSGALATADQVIHATGVVYEWSMEQARASATSGEANRAALEALCLSSDLERPAGYDAPALSSLDGSAISTEFTAPIVAASPTKGPVLTEAESAALMAAALDGALTEAAEGARQARHAAAMRGTGYTTAALGEALTRVGGRAVALTAQRALAQAEAEGAAEREDVRQAYMQERLRLKAKLASERERLANEGMRADAALDEWEAERAHLRGWMSTERERSSQLKLVSAGLALALLQQLGSHMSNSISAGGGQST